MHSYYAPISHLNINKPRFKNDLKVYLASDVDHKLEELTEELKEIHEQLKEAGA